MIITSDRAVTVNSVTANWNSNDYGVRIDTTGASAGVGKVIVTGAVVNHNGKDGIRVFADGTVSLSSIEAISNSTSNDYDGIHIEAIWLHRPGAKQRH